MTPGIATARRDPVEAPEGPQRPPLRISKQIQTPTPQRRHRQLLRPVTIATAVIVGSLLAVVVGNMVLASGQLQLEQLQTKLAAKESRYALKLERFTEDQSPQAAAAASLHYGLVLPDLVLPIPAASLTHRLAPPTFSSSPCCALTPGR